MVESGLKAGRINSNCPTAAGDNRYHRHYYPYVTHIGYLQYRDLDAFGRICVPRCAHFGLTSKRRPGDHYRGPYNPVHAKLCSRSRREKEIHSVGRVVLRTFQKLRKIGVIGSSTRIV
ncbi:hypothetical protein H5410_014079 [Solanum commersonii]|uniref:Uncharacterized protein n=1 Tax=Solanum commersonii TaxID=4109 RepID=A0A9J5ZQD9_SOLCO|nr:hypothetical protein H5410_014079 [Solanum commersonii]